VTGTPSQHPLITARRTRWALDPGHEVTDEQLRVLFDAGRWAASRGNLQPARFLVGRRGTDTFDALLDVLMPSNRVWAQAASALAMGMAVTTVDDRANRHAWYDLGQACGQLALQAVAMDLEVHQMAGFSAADARVRFGVPDDCDPVVAIAIGRPGPVDALPADLRAKQERPRTRLPLDQVVFTGRYGTPAFP
jgi:nitroreductase